MGSQSPLVNAILGIIIPPLCLFLNKGCVTDTIINLILWLLLFGLGGILHCFYVLQVECVTNILCFFIPPLGLWYKSKRCGKEEIICLILCLLFWLPGMIYAYYIVLGGKSCC